MKPTHERNPMKKVNYLVLDTETATLPFVNEIATNAEEKKKLAIARPLVYDIGWTIANRTDGIIERKNFLVAETFAVPAIFNTAYYASKRPLYIDMIDNGELTILPWNDIMSILIADMEECDYVCAYNAMFDFCKAIPFTDLYISKLYSSEYFAWEAMQKRLCRNILTKPYAKKESDFDPNNFYLRGQAYPMIDIWGLACTNIIQTNGYRNACLENGWISNSGTYFSTNAENAKRYIDDKYNFVEDHTALSDAEIETAILMKGLKNGKKIIGIIYFPFRMLGDTVEYVMNHKVTKAMAENLLQKLVEYIGDTEEVDYTNYQKQVAKKIVVLDNYITENWVE